MKRNTLPLVGIAIAAAVCPAALAAPQTGGKAVPAPAVWIEGEAATLPDGIKPNIAGWGHPEFLSGQKWLQLSVDADKVDTTVPDTGITLRYALDIPAQGAYEVWNRIGYEFVRSPFEWRIDDGAWKTITPNDLTTDLMELAEWTEVAWIKMGDAPLAPGKHTLEIRLTKTRDDKGKTARILYASDALCLSAAPFHPNGRVQPGEDSRTEDDKKAAAQVFRMGEKAPNPSASPSPAAPGEGAGGRGSASRISTPLNGLWEVCRDDEQSPGEVATPIAALPPTNAQFWHAIPVPSDKNTSRPDLLMAHRLWYRTRVDIPASLSGRSFVLNFPQNSLNTTVYINGIYCGFNKNPHAPFSLDVTKGIHPGQVNEVWVGIRDAWYGHTADPARPLKLRRTFNLPLRYFSEGFQDLAYPVWNAPQSGILQTPELVAAGSVYTSDTFVKTVVGKSAVSPSPAAWERGPGGEGGRQIAIDVTLLDPTGKGASGELVCEAVDAKTGQVAKALPPQPFTLAPGGKEQTVTVSGSWPDAKLWWPEPDPQLYRLRTTVRIGGQPVDTSEVTFGFREWGSKGKDFTLNGQVWHGWADLNGGSTPAEWLKNYRSSGQRLMRLAGYAQGGMRWQGLTPEEALRFFDENGVVVRRSGILDGERIGYNAIENDPEMRAKYGGSQIKMDLINNWIDQEVAQVKAERNHPSIHLWSLENEWLYINCINLYGNLMDDFEREAKRCGDAVAAVDPTRLWMTDGGGSGKGNIFPVHGDHYVFGEGDPHYPEKAYEANPTGGGRGRWTWDQQRPRYLGEDYFANGINPADFAVFGGEETFQGKASTRKAAGLIQRMLTEGYRWAGYGAWHFWLGRESAINQYTAFAPLAAFIKEWDTTFGAGQKVTRTVGVFNDDFHTTQPITFTWTLTLGGKKVASATKTLTIAPGQDEKFSITVPMPTALPAGTRQDGTLTLALSVNGKEHFRDDKPVSVLGKPGALTPNLHPQAGTRPGAAGEGRKLPVRRTLAASTRQPSPPLLTAWERGPGGEGSPILLYDPKNSVTAYLKAQGLTVTPVVSLDRLPQDGRVLLVGKDALEVAESTSSRLAAWASAGRTVIVLEQQNPLAYQAIPAAMQPTNDTGRIAYADDPNHPVLKRLTDRDFFTWGPEQTVFQGAYQKPTAGGRSLIQCGNRLADTALAEVPVGKGLLLLSQLRVGETVATNAVAQRLLTNLISYGAAYRPQVRPVVVAAKDDPQFADAVRATGVTFASAADPLAALRAAKAKIVVAAASPANLKALAANRPLVDKFTAGGGYLLLSGLTPEGLADYNHLVGVDHMIRPFRRERVTFPAQRNPLTAGLTAGDIVLQSGKRINDYTSDVFLASDVFSYCVDYDEVAPFAKLPDPQYFGNKDADNDHNPYNMVNGFFSADGWQYIFSIWAGSPGGPKPVPMVFPKPQTITRMEWAGNAFYWPTKRVELTFDGKAPASFTTEPNNEPQTFAVKAPGPATTVTVAIKEWDSSRAQNAIVGIDNIRLWAKRSPEFYKTVHPLLNIGALMEYDRGAGGIVLCNIHFKDTEEVPENGIKKRRILATLLRNMDAPFGGERSIIAGTPLAYAPIDLAGKANQYRNEQGWFGDKAFTFASLPSGGQTFANVRYQVYDFKTSPVPTAVMLGGSGVPGNLPESVTGIAVNRKADALFFLQAARIDRRRDDRDRRAGKQYELAHYVVHYADGKTETIPIYSEIDVDDYKQQGKPKAIPGAQIAWTAPYPGTDYVAVAYSKQWNNPRPQMPIASVDLEYGADKGRGVPVLLAITAATQPTTTAPAGKPAKEAKP